MRATAARAGIFLAVPLFVWACATAPRWEPPAPFELSSAAFLDSLQSRTFDWFWALSDSRTGLTPDRWPTESFSSVAAVGFALTAYAVGAERGWVTREEAEERVLATLRFFWQAPQDSVATGVTGYKGFFYHFLDMETGHRFETVELSTIDTALLLAGVLTAREYFDETDDPGEVAIRAHADSIYRRVDWRWAQVRAPLVSMGWKPETGFLDYDWRGYNEAMILYVLALGSPTHAVDPAAWDAWTETYRWGEFQGQEHLGFAPLFGHQYSHVWIDFRGIQDAYMRERGIDYFENSRRATLAQRAYAVANPEGWVGYGSDVWGLTASDGPTDTTLFLEGRPRTFYSYAARGAGPDDIRDDGTIAPTAVGGSMAFAPEIALPALIEMRRHFGDQLYGEYGFLDAFNPTFTATDARLKHGRVVAGSGWFDTDYLGIDQGPILLMIENHRTGLVWELMRKSPYVVRGLCRAGFRGGWLEGRC
ncbi:MAG: glucoamylase family protein [Gemmatimonadota bacterium]